MEFTHRGVRYRTSHAPGSHRVSLYRKVNAHWTLDHGKNIPPGMSAKVVAEVMRRYITGEIDAEAYNAILPGK